MYSKAAKSTIILTRNSTRGKSYVLYIPISTWWSVNNVILCNTIINNCEQIIPC